MTPPSGRRDFSSTVTAIRAASAGCRAGGADAFGHFEKFVNSVFCLTVGHPRACLRLQGAKGRKTRAAVLMGGYGTGDPPVVQLRDGRYLKFVVSLYRDEFAEDDFLRTSQSLYQYQLSDDADADDWAFRYEYKRGPVPEEAKPKGHLHIQGELLAGVDLPGKKMLKHIHFPCGRPTVEALVRLLVDDFGVPADAPDDVWRPLLRQTEQEFLSVAHAG